MQKRIVILPNAPEASEACARQAEARGLTFTKPGAGGALPVATVALVSAQCDDALLAAAQSLGARTEELLYLLAEAIDSREGFSRNTSRRVQEHASRMAMALNLSPEDRLLLERAALLRDIGKLHISNEVLLKRDVLTYDEWTLIQQHAHLGAELLLETAGLGDSAVIVRQHHECWDGTGYPDGLEGESIAYLARVMKILDVYCAMTSPRHYRRGSSSHEQTVQHLLNERGKHFDPALVDIFINANIGQVDR